MGQGLECDIRDLVSQIESRPASHFADDGQRPGPNEIYENLQIDEDLLEPEFKRIIIADDLLTTGAHFKAVKRKLADYMPDKMVFGLFIARRAVDADDIDF